ncbi:MAG: copper resistance protein B [Gallionella sp.]
MMKSRIKWKAATIAVLSLSPACAQDQSTISDSNAQAKKMQGMDQGGMSRQAMPEMSGAMPGMSDQQGSGDAPVQNHDMGNMDHGNMSAQQGAAPTQTGTRDPHAYSDGYTLNSGPYALPGPRQLRLADEHNFGALLVNQLEQVYTGNGNTTAYDAQAWFGRDYDRMVIKAEGGGKLQDARTELLWGHAVASYWDMQLGARHDSGTGPNQDWLAMGVQGLAPYWFAMDATAYAGDNGKTAFRLAAEYELLFTQQLILQPRVEINLYGKNDPARDIGSGLSDAISGMRLRYEFTRQFAPYVGIEWAGKFGETANFARVAGAKTSGTRWVTGVRFWF